MVAPLLLLLACPAFAAPPSTLIRESRERPDLLDAEAAVPLKAVVHLRVSLDTFERETGYAFPQ